ncbi:hypothetical protein NKH09_10400 [Mesorhizobium sp. M1339]|uniref:hypothetical protein n=1 Tax=Mesorhizobium sp. M1339 TaxID=2957086 RepID=UPI00333BE9BC
MEEDQASSDDGIGLNLEYADYRGVPIEEAIEAVEEEAQLLVDIAEAGWDTDEAEAVVEENMEAMGLTGPLIRVSPAWCSPSLR